MQANAHQLAIICKVLPSFGLMGIWAMIIIIMCTCVCVWVGEGGWVGGGGGGGGGLPPSSKAEHPSSWCIAKGANPSLVGCHWTALNHP